jgi:hypothetical protein
MDVHGNFFCVIGEIECIQQHRGEVTGVAPGDGDLREWSPALFCCGNQTNRGRQRGRPSKTGRGDTGRGRGAFGTHRGVGILPTAVACSGEKLLGPGSAIGRGKKGEKERRGRALYRHGMGSKWKGN